MAKNAYERSHNFIYTWMFLRQNSKKIFGEIEAELKRQTNCHPEVIY